MSIDQKWLLNRALKIAVVVAESSSNSIDDVVVKACVDILKRVFSLED